MVTKFRFIFSMVTCFILFLSTYSAAHSHKFSQEDIKNYKNQIKMLTRDKKVFKVIKDVDAEQSPLTYDEIRSIFIDASNDAKAKKVLKNRILTPDGHSIAKELIFDKLSETEGDFSERKKLLLSIYKDKKFKKWSRRKALLTLAKDVDFKDKALLRNLLEEKVCVKGEAEIVIKSWRCFAGRNDLNIDDRVPNFVWFTKFIDQQSKKKDFSNYAFTLFKSYKEDKDDALIFLTTKYKDRALKKDKKAQDYDAQYRIISTILDLTNGWEDIVKKPDLFKMVIGYSFGDNKNMNPERPNIASLLDCGYDHKVEFAKYLTENFNDFKGKVGREELLKTLYLLRFRKNEPLRAKALELIEESLKNNSQKERYLAYKLTPKYTHSRDEAFDFLKPLAKNEKDEKCRKYLMSIFTDEIFN